MADQKNISDVFNNLKTSIIGTKTSEIDAQIDSAFKNIKNISSSTDRNQYIDVMKDVVSKVGEPENIDELLNTINHSGGVESLQQGDRIQRYKSYDAIVSNISYCKRALKVLVDNILSPDDITKRTIQILADYEDEMTDGDQTIDAVISRCKHIKKKLKIEKHIDSMVNKTMKFGDFFVEILYSPKGQNALTIVTDAKRNIKNETDIFNTLLTENVDIVINKENKKVKINVYEYHPFGTMGGTLGERPPTVSGAGASFANTHTNYNYKSQSKDPNITKKVNDTSWEEDKFKTKFDPEEESIDEPIPELKDIFLAFHDAKYVIRLETERFRTCLGYLVFPKMDLLYASNAGGYNVQMNDVDAICANIITSLQTKITSGRDSLPKIGDLRDVIANYLKTVKDNDDLNIRYVSPHLMSHWRIDVNKFDPYGESIFDSVAFDSKLLMALKTATTIKRLTSATDKRIISVESGLQRDAKQVVEMTKEVLRKRKISIDKFGSVDSIPSNVTTFEDIYIPMKDGKKFIEFDHQQFGPQAQEDIEPLKFIRDNIVANLYVPAPFLGLEENTCLSFYTQIPLLEGFTTTIGKLVEEYEKDPENFNQYVYSIDPKTQKVVAGKITKAMRTRKNAEMVRVHLDNGKYTECTPDHRWMMRDGTYKEAKDLCEGDSLMPLYVKKSGRRTRNNVPYMQVYHPGTNRYQLIHRAVTEGLGTAKKNDGMDVHHIDENPLNNHVDNLLVCTKRQHLKIHEKHRYNPADKNTYSIKETRNCVICNTEFETRIQNNQTTCLNKKCLKERKRLDGIKSWEKRKAKQGDLYDTVEATCAACNKTFHTYKKYLDEATHNMISCGDYECGRIVSGRKTTLTKLGEPVETNCVICETPITITNPKKNKTQTCSIKCQNTVLARRRHAGNRQEGNCSFCNATITTTDHQRRNNRYIPCDKPECKTAKQGVELYLANNPDLTFDDYLQLFNTRQLPFQIDLDNRKDKPIFDDNLISVTKDGRSEQYQYNCDFCHIDVTVPKHEWDKKKYQPTKSCKSKSCADQAKGHNTSFHRFGKLPEFKEESVALNHKVVKIEFLTERQDCCDIEVEKYHNFAIEAGVFVHNSNRSLLSVENIMFARAIISYQFEFSELLHDLFDKIYTLVYPDAINDLDNIKITFPPPKASPYEHQMEYIEQMERIVNALEPLGVPKSWAKKKYLPDLPWDEIDRARAGENVDKELSEVDKEDDFGSGGLSSGF